MNILDHNGKNIVLKQNDYLAEGGEGRLYAKGDRVFKIYHEQNHALPLAKIEELQSLQRNNIIRPLGPIFDNDNCAIGFSMIRVLRNSIALPRVFSNTFWQQNGFTIKDALHLIERMRDTIRYIHDRGFLQVDGNEFNYLVSPDFKKVYFIDVDSYQTPNYAAKAIMPSIRDYTQNTFNPSTDWFSFAVVAFQILTGIHPFKGRHSDFKAGDFAGRIQANLSVLNPEVRYPAAVRDFRLIPKNYLRWFEEMFEQGKRTSPPDRFDSSYFVQNKRLIKDKGKLNIKAIAQFAENIVRFKAIHGRYLIHTANILYNGKQAVEIPRNFSHCVLFEGKPLFFASNNAQLQVFNPESQKITLANIAVESLFVSNNCLYAFHHDQLLELGIRVLAGNIVINVNNSRSILPNGVQVFDGLLMQNVLSKWQLILPVKSGFMPMIFLPELDAYRIIEAKYENGLAVFRLADKKGNYFVCRLRLNQEFTQYDIEISEEQELTDALNFTVLNSGVAVNIMQEGEILLISNQPHSTTQKLVQSDQAGTFMRLANDGDGVLFHDDHTLYRMSLT